MNENISKINRLNPRRVGPDQSPGWPTSSQRSSSHVQRSAILALVASAAVGVATLIATGADARPNGGGGHSGGGHRGVGHGHHGQMIRHIRHHGHHRHVPPVHRHRHGHHHHHHHHRHRHVHHCFWPHGHHHHRHCHGHHVHLHWRRYWVGATYARPVYPVAARPVASNCTCLVKEYLPNGSVLFRDGCTNEAAVNPPVQAAAQ